MHNLERASGRTGHSDEGPLIDLAQICPGQDLDLDPWRLHLSALPYRCDARHGGRCGRPDGQRWRRRRRRRVKDGPAETRAGDQRRFREAERVPDGRVWRRGSASERVWGRRLEGRMRLGTGMDRLSFMSVVIKGDSRSVKPS